ncbi:MAG: PA14 domain-containing protein [Thermoplasmatota archaeon]
MKVLLSNRLRTFSVLTMFVLVSISILMAPPSEGSTIPTRASALDGHYPVAESAYATFIGSGEESPQGRLGEFVGHADVNGDGIEDIAMAATQLFSPEGEQHSGVCYIWYGNETLPKGNIDLETDPPDIKIIGTSEGANLLSSISAGDLNDDGLTDIALGMPQQGDSGKVYVLWGRPAGWENEITLYKAGNAEPNGNPIGFLRRDDFAIISGFVSTNVLGTKLGKTVIIEDLDGDGSEDLLFSFHGWNKVFVIWGGYSKTSFGSEYTYIMLDENNVDVPGDYGNTMEVGDLNNDGMVDLVIGAPLYSHEERDLPQTGALFVYYNTSDIRNYAIMDSLEGCRPLIYGQDPYDRLGRGLVIEDINNDDMDDIIAGAPDANGVVNQRPGAGQIMVFRGGNITKFPSVGRAEEIYDLMIVGANQRTEDEPGDTIGDTFDVGDFDGDAKMELVIGIPGKEVSGQQSVGMVMGYDDGSVFPSTKGIVDLKNVPMKFSLWGSEIEDVTGYSLSLFDANDDGADDLLVGSPSADGIDNLRPGCGEVALLTGTAISIKGLSLSGPAYVNGKVLPGYGPFSIVIPFSHTDGASNIGRIEVVLEKGTVDAKLVWESGSFSYQGPSIASIDPGNCRYVLQGAQGSIAFTTFIDWYSDLGRAWDIDVRLEDGDGRTAERTFHDLMFLNNRIELLERFDTFIDGKKAFPGDWQRQGSSLEVMGMELVYRDTGGVPVPPGDLGISLERNGMNVHSIDYIDDSSVLKDDLLSLDLSEYVIAPVFYVTQPTDAPGSPPGLSGTISFHIIIDTDDPDVPENLRLIPDPGRDSVFDDDGLWVAEWNATLGPRGDHNSSGVKEYMIKEGSGAPVPVMLQGGLWGTYYDLSEFSIFSFQRMDRYIDHRWGYWGPNAQRLTPSSFSIRWHGWLAVDETRSYRFSLTGNGEGRLFLDDELIIDRDDLEDSPTSAMVPLEEGVPVPIVVYYSNDDLGKPEVSSSVSLLYLDDRGAMSPVPPYMLFHPGNSTEVASGDEDLINVEVSAVDWVGHSSGPASAWGYTDRDAPNIDLSDIRPWYNNTTPLLNVFMNDPPTSYRSGSGIDLGTIEYRLIDEYGWGDRVSVEKGVEIISYGEEGPAEVKVGIRPTLIEGAGSSIQWYVSDLCGNEMASEALSIGVDLKAPGFNVLSPDLTSFTSGTGLNIACMASVPGGSGVDGSSILWRLGSGDTWSDWISARASGVEEELRFNISVVVAAGENMLQMKASDAVGNTGESRIFMFSGTRAPVNEPPKAVIVLPTNGTKVRSGIRLTLDASGSSDDGLGEFPVLRFSWFSDLDGYLGGDVTMDVHLEKVGRHRITVYVDDGSPGHNVSASVQIEVLPATPADDDDDDGEGGKVDIVSVLLIIVSLIVVSVVLGMIIKSVVPKGEGETRMDVVERTEDDEEYEERTRDEDRFMEGEAEEPENDG